MTGGSALAVLAMAAALALAAFAMYAVMINLIRLLTSRGASGSTAAWALGLGGIGQVTGRLGYGALVRRTSVRARTVWILALSAATTAALAAIPGPVALLIAVAFLAGTTRGIAALLQAIAVSDRWGTASYGALSGILAGPTATAVAPFAGAAITARIPTRRPRRRRPDRLREALRPADTPASTHPGGGQDRGARWSCGVLPPALRAPAVPVRLCSGGTQADLVRVHFSLVPSQRQVCW
jgi:MFS family permease